jgi:hypothetical protein
MTDKGVMGGWVVSVMTHGRGNQPAQFYDVAEAAPIAAELAVLKHINAMDEKIEAVERVPGTVIDELGLSRGEIRKRV